MLQVEYEALVLLEFMLRQMERYYLSIGFPYFMLFKRIGLESSHIKYIKTLRRPLRVNELGVHHRKTANLAISILIAGSVLQFVNRNGGENFPIDYVTSKKSSQKGRSLDWRHASSLICKEQNRGTWTRQALRTFTLVAFMDSKSWIYIKTSRERMFSFKLKDGKGF